MNARNRNGLLAAATCIILVAHAAGLRAEVRYTITEIGTMGGRNSFATAVNNAGQVAGYTVMQDATMRAFLFDDGIISDLGFLPGGRSSQALGINDAGQVVGACYVHSDGRQHAFRYSDGGMTDIGRPEYQDAFACDINNAGQAVGYGGVFPWVPFVYGDGTMSNFTEGHGGRATSINDSGLVTGFVTVRIYDPIRDRYSVVYHAYQYSDGVLTHLPTFGAATLESRGMGINNAGQIVGWGQLQEGPGRHAFLYSDGVLTDLGTLGWNQSRATGINDSGLIVGYLDNGSTVPRHAFVYDNGIMMDLNDLVDPAARWRLISAAAVNNRGQIVGYGTNSLGEGRGFLLTPIPEPLTLVGMALGVCGLVRYVRRRA